jgi:glutamate N-acetyltransferase/amino-acid N-acetyltransferase
VRSGVRRKRLDLALIVAEGGATAAAIFTRNRFPAAPVALSRSALRRSGGRVRAAVVNAGCANAITGKAGIACALRVRRRAAQLLDCDPGQVFLASTGVIGTPLPEAKIRAALPEAVARLSPGGLDAASQAILTTDIGPKVAAARFRLGGRLGRIVGFAKGAGMIHPDMATMLAFVMTDAPATPEYLRAALHRAADGSFNAISVDGDTSTNDTVLLMASGRLAGPPLAGGAEAADFERALAAVCGELAWRIVRDGEGATRVMDVYVRGAASSRDARLAAHAVATSPLVKTALHGGDPNWGRILAAVGRSGARFSARRTSLSAGGLCLVSGGEPGRYRERDAARVFARERVPLTIDLGAGAASARVLASDLGHDYVTLNADYRS